MENRSVVALHVTLQKEFKLVCYAFGHTKFIKTVVF